MIRTKSLRSRALSTRKGSVLNGRYLQLTLTQFRTTSEKCQNPARVPLGTLPGRQRGRADPGHRRRRITSERVLSDSGWLARCRSSERVDVGVYCDELRGAHVHNGT